MKIMHEFITSSGHRTPENRVIFKLASLLGDNFHGAYHVSGRVCLMGAFVNSTATSRGR